jgi:microcin C transport system substrate-binding protein
VLSFLKCLFFSLGLGVVSFFAIAEDSSEPLQGVAIYGDVKYPKDFKHFDYVNPQSPKGGILRREAAGTFDSFNPFVIKGQAAVGIQELVYASLTAHSYDEPGSCYGYLAESIEISPDRTWIIFNLRSEATFHDGTPIRAEDVLYSFNMLITKGVPFYKGYYKAVRKIEALNDLKVKFTLDSSASRELAVILGQFPVFSKSFTEKHGFEKSDLSPPLGSGPYKIGDFKAGKYLTYDRIKNWWGEKIPVNRGRYNFDHMRFDYFRDPNIAFEAFKSHSFDFHIENVAKNWATGYDFPAFKEGKVFREETIDREPAPMQGFLYNTRRPLFQDRKVREALAYALDFEWMNQHLFHNAYRRTQSYFQRSDLASSGLPQGEELKILESYRDQLPPEVFSNPFVLPSTNKPSSLRLNLEKAKQILKEAGWQVQKNILVNVKTGKPFVFEILLGQPSLERIIQGLINNLKRLGIEARVRTVDSAQYLQRVENYDFDMISAVIPQSSTPGNEQREFWLSSQVNIVGGFNWAGVKSPVVDQLVNLVIDAPDRESLNQRVHALDRVLLWGYYVIPGWHSIGTRVAYWLPLKHPATLPSYGIDLMCWWMDRETTS